MMKNQASEAREENTPLGYGPAAATGVHSESGAVDEQPGKSRPIRDMIAVNFGNALEWYDWNIYTIFAPYFAVQIFNPENPTSSLLATLAVFAVGFVARPVGGYIFGAYADRVGRKKSLFLAMLLTALGSLIIAVTPTYAATGVFASIILVAARLMQGLAHGGEMGTSVTYLVERAPKSRRALFGSTSWVSVVVGTMLATLTGILLSSILSETQLADWGWRIAFGVGGLLGLYALYLRRLIRETDSFTQSDAVDDAPTENDKMEKRPGLFTYWRGLLIVFGLSAGGSLMFYTWLIYLPTHAQVEYGTEATVALTASLIAQVAFLLAILGAGVLGDRIGRKPMVIAFGIAFIILPFPVNMFLDGTFALLLTVQLITLGALALLFGVNGAIWSEVFPTHVRAKGVATTLSAATAIFGGTAPYIITALSNHGYFNIFLVYLMVVSAATLLTGLLMKETKNIDITE